MYCLLGLFRLLSDTARRYRVSEEDGWIGGWEEEGKVVVLLV